MTQVSPAPSITGSPAIRQIPSGNGGQSGFALEPAAPECPRVQVSVTAPEPAEPDADARQAVAGTGKDLPGQDELADSEDERTEADAPFAWFGFVPPTPEAAPAIVVAGQPMTAAVALPEGAVALPEGEAAPLPEILLPEALTQELAKPAEVAADPVTAEIAKAVEGFDLAAAAPVDVAPEAPVRPVQGIQISRPVRSDASARIELPANSPLLQTLAALQPRTEATPIAATPIAATPFAAALATAGIELPEQFRRPAPREASVAVLTPVNGLEMQRAGIVQAVADVQQAAIDTRRSDWMTSTIERIEALRDSPNSRETSIRLSPDALGKVDVSIRQEGDRIHVRFTAETATARTLLTEAQSRLNDIAEARGLKLGQTSVDAGTAGGTGHWGQRHDAAPKSNPASAPASAPGGETETATDANARVA